MPRPAPGPSHPVVVHRMAAFTNGGIGGNPAGVVVTDEPLARRAMQRIAADIGYSETVFAVARGGSAYGVRYFAPRTEITFCGHATIALGVLLADMHGPATYHLDTPAGEVPVQVAQIADGLVATLTSVEPSLRRPEEAWVDDVLDTLAWTRRDLDPQFPPALAYAGAWHLLLMAASRERLRELTYDFERLLVLMKPHDLATVAVMHRQAGRRFSSRNLFPTGGVPEDPATGAAAAAFGAYLRELGHPDATGDIDITQGEDMGSPCSLRVRLRPSDSRVDVSGSAVRIGAPEKLRADGAQDS